MKGVLPGLPDLPVFVSRPASLLLQKSRGRRILELADAGAHALVPAAAEGAAYSR
jgi:hypothetical protein